MNKSQKKRKSEEKTEAKANWEKAEGISDDGIGFIRLLMKTKAEDLREGFPENKLYIAHKNDLSMEVFKGLIRHNFFSVPVVLKNGKYYGFLDLFDFVKMTVEYFGKDTLRGSENFWDLVKSEDHFQKKRVHDIMEFPRSKRNPFHPVYRGYSLLSAFEILCRERGVKQIPVIDEDFSLLLIITQTQALDFINKNMNLLGSKKDKTVENIMHSAEVITVQADQTAISAFQKIVDLKVGGLAVIDENGKLIGNLSTKDLKIIGGDAHLFWRLYETVSVFLEKNLEKKKLISCQSSDTFESVVQKLAENRVHRIYIVDENQTPQGVITISDIISEVLSF